MIMKKLLLLLVMMLLPMIAIADTVEIDGIYYNLVKKAKEAEVTRNPNNPYYYTGDITIPESIIYEGIEYSVTSIGLAAFYPCQNLTSIIIPNSVTSIGEQAFMGCTQLTSITIPNSVSSISKNTFYECTNLTNVLIPNSVTSIGEAAFMSCANLASISLPNQLTYIGGRAFCYCHKLTDITIPNSVTFIGNSAFCECPNLTSITIPSNITTIYYGTFWGCKGLTSITIPNSVISIGGMALYDCSGLTNVIIGNGLKYIHSKAFSNCKELIDVYCHAESVPTTASDAFLDSYQEYITLHVPANSISSYQQTEPWNTFKAIVDINAVQYTLTYMVDGNIYKQYSLEEGATITPEPAPTKEGYTFSGWSEIPETMPAHDVTITGSFVPNKYQLTYKVDGEVYKSYNIEYGAIITPEPAPTKEGYTFSGWSEIPATMPDHDVTVTGTFTINKYKLTYKVDGELYKSYEIEYGATITPEPAPNKDGYTFSGWSWIPTKMPAENITVIGSFSINKYKLTYLVDGEVYKSYDVEYGATISPEPSPTKDGYIFSGWSDIPTTMPAHDVTVSGTFNIQKYKLTYFVDNAVYKIYYIEYGTSITPDEEPTKEGYTFSGWSWIPTKMPAEDVSVSGYFIVNQYTITYIIDNEVYTTDKVDYGSTITPPTPPSREGYDFAWGDYPETMPAHNITIYGTYTTGIDAIMVGECGNAKIYTLDGKLLDKPQKGINIVRMNDGTTKKVVVK